MVLGYAIEVVPICILLTVEVMISRVERGVGF